MAADPMTHPRAAWREDPKVLAECKSIVDNIAFVATLKPEVIYDLLHNVGEAVAAVAAPPDTQDGRRKEVDATEAFVGGVWSRVMCLPSLSKEASVELVALWKALDDTIGAWHWQVEKEKLDAASAPAPQEGQ